MGKIIFITKIRIISNCVASAFFVLGTCALYADCASGNCQNGYGEFAARSGGRILFKYAGNWKNGKFHGKGTRVFFDRNGKTRSEYIGNWSHGKRNGQGVLKGFLDGQINSECSGSWQRNEMHGSGACVYFAQGRKISIMRGRWNEGKEKGPGTYERYGINGKLIARIKGRFRGDYANGTLWEYKNGKVIREYRGEFLNYSKHGKGRLKHADGKIEEGTWVRGKLVSK